VYHDTLVANGVSTYTWEQCNADFNDAIWTSACCATFGGKMVATFKAQAEAAAPGSPEQAESTMMAENMGNLFVQVASRCHKLAEVRDAYASAPFELCPEDAKHL
jgi:hypothetical protein